MDMTVVLLRSLMQSVNLDMSVEAQCQSCPRISMPSTLRGARPLVILDYLEGEEFTLKPFNNDFH